MARSLGFYGDGIRFGWSWPIILIQCLSWWRRHHSAKMDASERDSGKWTDMGCLLLTFPNSSDWWWLISSLFLTRISCHKTTHANGYYGTWPGWAVSVNVLPLTT